jgi:hypothetical protein
MKHIMNKSFYYSLILLSVLLVIFFGCSRNPTIEISGAFFPGWMISITIGITLTIIARILFLKKGIDEHLQPPLLTYGALALGATLLSWILLYF